MHAALAGESVLYEPRIGRGRRATLSLRPDSTAIALGATRVSSYDLAGRPYVLVRGDTTWRRALDGRLLEKRTRTGRRLRRVVSAAEGAKVIEAARLEAAELLSAVRGGAAAQRLRRIVAMDGPALAADAARFREVYSPVGILPPDQYLALVLQATEGCSWNRCTFCDSYRGTRFRVKTAAEFERHLRDVRAFFGPALALRRSLFLGDANALCADDARLATWLTAAEREFPALRVSSFVDAWTGARRDAPAWRRLAAHGLSRVYVGLETGDPELLDWLRKPGRPEDAVELVGRLHEAGTAVGVIVLLGAGGERFSAAHVERTAEALSRMHLGGHDLLYFSELVLHPGLPYERHARSRDLRPLGAAACAAQRKAIEARLGGRLPARAASYDIREFVY